MQPTDTPTQSTHTKSYRHMLAEGFVVGFASTAGMMFAYTVVINRSRIKAAFKALAA